MLGVSGARNLLPTGSPSWGSRIGRAKAFCAQAPALPLEPARLLRAEASSHRWPEKIFWQLHSAKGNSPRAANHSPNAPRIEKATQAVFAPGPPLSVERTGAGLPRLPGPCCFAGCLRCPKPTPHGFSFVGKQDWAREGLLRPAPAMPLEPARPLSAEAPLHRRPKTSFWELHSAKGNTPPAANHSPNAPRIQRATQAVFAPSPTLSIAQRRAGLPLATRALLLYWVSSATKTFSPRVLLRGEAGLGARRSSVPRPQPCPLSQLGRSAPRPHHTERPKRASGSCILQRETLLGQQTTAPTRLESRKQRKPFSAPAPRSR